MMVIGGTAVAWPIAVHAQQPAKVARIGTSSPWRCFGSGSPMRRSSAPISAFRCSGVEHPKILGRDRFEFCRPRSQSSRRCMSVFWQLVREKFSGPQMSRNRAKSARHFKGHFPKCICKFESFMPSQPVWSLQCDFRMCKNHRHSRGLGCRARVSGRQFPDFWPCIGRSQGSVSARQFSISVSACRRPVRHVTETGSRKGAHVAARFLAQFRADRTEDRLQSIA